MIRFSSIDRSIISWPDSDLEVVDLTGGAVVGAFVFIILWILLPTGFAGLFGLIYLVYIMTKIDRNNKILLNQR